MTELFNETFATEFHAACIKNGYNMKEVIANPNPYLKGFIESRERERQEMKKYILANAEAFKSGTIEEKINADFAC